MKDLIRQLSIADPELAETVQAALRQKSSPVSFQDTAMLLDETMWGLSREISFGYAVALGYAELIGEVPADLIQKYRQLIREAVQNGPTLGRIMATYLVPVLKYGNNGFLEHFLHTIHIMRTKGTYTLKTPLESLASLLNAGDSESGPGYLDLLCDTFSQELTYNQSLHLSHNLPKAVLSFPSSKRSWQIRQFRRIIKTDFRMTDTFLEGMERGLHLLSVQALERFVSLGLEKLQHDKKRGAKFLSLESKQGIDAYNDMLVTASISQVQPQLNRYLRARTGVALSVVSSKGAQAGEHEFSVYSDGKTICLPEEISIFERKAENLNLYKCFAKLESAYYEFGTYDFDLEKAMERCQLKQPPDLRPLTPDPHSDMERFFLLFPVKSLASDLFTLFEHGRIRLMLNRFYPGIVRQCFPMLQREATRLCKGGQPVDVIFLLYAEIALGISAEASFGVSDDVREQVKKFVHLFEIMMEDDQAVETCAELVLRTYSEMEFLLTKAGTESLEDFCTPLKTPFGRTLRPELFFSTHQNSERIAKAIKIRLEEKGVKTYKSDIRKRLMENSGNISPEDIREIILHPNQSSGPGEIQGQEMHFDLSWLDLSELLGNTGCPAIQADDVSGPVSWYKEWDCSLGDYLHNHTRVAHRLVTPLETGENDFYEQTLKRHQGLVRRIRYAFELLKPEELTILRQWTEGDEFDYRALLDFVMDKRAGIMPSDRLYIKRIKQQRDVAVLLLADISRSTANLVPPPAGGMKNIASAFPTREGGQSVLDIEKEAVVLFCEALSVVGDAFAIAGFSGTGRLGVDYFRIKDFENTLDHAVKERISTLSPQRSTRMGAAIRHAASQLEKVSARVRLLIILGDGFPNDTDYKREHAIEDTRKAIFEARSKNIYTKAITVNLAGDSKLDALYGSIHHNVISDVRELPDRLLRLYSALTR